MWEEEIENWQISNWKIQLIYNLEFAICNSIFCNFVSMSRETKNWILLITLAGVWGSSFILMKRGMFSLDGHPIFSDGQVASLRIGIAGLVLSPFAIRALKQIQTWKEFLSLAIVGILGNLIPAYLFTYAETGISSGYAGMLNSFAPIFTMLVGIIIFKNRLTFMQWIGLFIGTIGIILLILADDHRSENLKITGSWIHVVAIVIATFFYGVSLNTIKFTLQKFKAFEITSLALFIVTLPAIITGGFLNTFETIQTNPYAMEGLGFILILSLVGTAISLILYNKLIQSSSTLFASSVTYFMPIVAVFIGLSFGEHINFNQIGAMIVVLLGVFIANYWMILFRKKKTE